MIINKPVFPIASNKPLIITTDLIKTHAANAKTNTTHKNSYLKPITITQIMFAK